MLLLLLASIVPAFAAAATLSGTVYLSGNPLPDTNVTVLDAQTEAVIDSTTTDSVGLYQLALDNGTYNLVIAPPANLGLSQSLVEDVVVNNEDITYHVVLIEPEVILNGVVTGADGTPAAGVQLSIYNRHSGQNVGVITTTDTGLYSFALAKGRYYINAQGRGENANILLISF